MYKFKVFETETGGVPESVTFTRTENGPNSEGVPEITPADVMDNRPEQCAIVSKPTYINCDPKTILGRLQGHYDYGDGRTKEDPNYMIFSSRNCNYPQPKYAKWFLSQYQRWGLLKGTPDYEGITKQVMRPDIYEEAMKEIGHTHGGLDNSKETLFDGVTFDPAGDLAAYAKGFAVNSVKG